MDKGLTAYGACVIMRFAGEVTASLSWPLGKVARDASSQDSSWRRIASTNSG